ncbi:MAG: fused MFS/spermidine synthase [Deltaproteobacteria bacterium]|nr:fused MFS/spermidine synthase [Deltaproteobacteria bacterium]
MHIAVFILFLGSGLTGLIYQVVWTKYLTLIFGVSLLAVSTVLSCFFGGLALGSYLGGKWVDRRGQGFTWYGAAEGLIGLYAFAFPSLLDLNRLVYTLIAEGGSLSFGALAILKFALSALILFIPTTLMGATLPILSKTIAVSGKRFARDIGWLYSINTVGAVIGAVLATFVLIPSLGLKYILYISGVVNILIGVAAAYLGRSYNAAAAPAPAAPRPSGKEELPRSFSYLLMASFGISGFTGLAYEVVWTRTLGFVLTGTVYAFTAVLAAFLTGIAVGSFALSSFADRVKGPSRLITILALVYAGIGLSSIGLINLYGALPSFDLFKKLDSTPVWSEFIYLNFLTSFLTLIVPALFFGATFPLVCKIYGMKAEGTGKKIGNIYSVNTVGGILGSFAGGFVLIPLIGMQNTIVLMGVVNIALGALVLLFNPFSKGISRFAPVAGMAVAAVAAVSLLPGNMPLDLHRSILKRGERIVFYEEGPAATVMIAEKEGAGLSASNKRLWINGNAATAAFYEGLQINRVQGVLPMVLHPAPKEVLVICFGSGTTFGTLSSFPVERVDNVEIAPTVVKGAGYFKNENRDVLHNPRAHVNFDDGRSFLAAKSRMFDVITEEPIHPSLAGVVNLYTKEYYELARSRLKPGGIMSQWIPLYNVSVEDMRMMVRTFRSVFPHTTIWLANADIFMIGSEARLPIDYARVSQKLAMPGVKSLLSEIDLEEPTEFLSTFLMSEEQSRSYAGEGFIMTDDMPLIEFTGPRYLHENTISPNLAEFLKYRDTVLAHIEPPLWMEAKERAALESLLRRKYEAGYYNIIARVYLAAQDFAASARYFNKALEVDPTDRNSLHYKKSMNLS